MKYLSVCVLAVAALVRVAAADEVTWLTDLNKAQAEAKQANKLVLLDFNGSDWCPACEILKKQVFSTPEFQNYAKQHLVLVDVDLPRAKELPKGLLQRNEALVQKFNVEGFPTVIVLGSNGKELEKKAGYDGASAKVFVAELEKLRTKQ